jgi:hypothetical protein
MTVVWIFFLLGVAQYMYKNIHSKAAKSQERPGALSLSVAKKPSQVANKPESDEVNKRKRKPRQPMPLELRRKLSTRKIDKQPTTQT